MPLIPIQNSVGLTSPQRTAIVGWGQSDEPDNAQPNGMGGYGPCLTPPRSSLPTTPSAPTTRPDPYFSTLVEAFLTPIGPDAVLVPEK